MEVFRHFLCTKGGRLTSALFIAVLSVFLITTPKPTHAENERVLTIFHDGSEQTIVTDAPTVGEALKRANITLYDHDIAEPAADTKLVAPGYDINIYRARPITIVDGAQVYQVMSAHTSARQIAADAGLTLYAEDTYTLNRIDDFVGDGGVGMKLTIQRAVPITFTLYGKQISIRTQSKTVGDLLKEKGVELGSQDGTSVPLSTAITTNLNITVWRDGVTTVTNEEQIAFTTRQIQDADQPFGYKAVQTPGVLGKKLVTYQVQMKNGQEVSRTPIQTVVTSQPQEQVEVIGVKAPVDLSAHKSEAMAAAGISQNDYGFVDYIVTRESGWCATKLQGNPGACPAVPPASIPTGLGYGLCQATPGSKMASSGADWQTNPVTQLKWCSLYAISRYGSWAAAYNHWLVSHNW